MDKNTLLAMAEDPRFIEGIYNYCDRWCERCPLTSRCLTYAMIQSEEGAVSGALDNEAFWKQIEAAFQLARELITDLAKQQGVDLGGWAAPAEAEAAPPSSPGDKGRGGGSWLSSHAPLWGRATQWEPIRRPRHYGQMVNDW